MSIKLGTTTASLYLGTTPVDRAYLGTVQVPRTLYFDGAVDNDWTELGNWWNDASHTEAATSLPTAADSVVATASIMASGQTVVNFTLNDPNEGAFTLSGTLNVTGSATFSGFSINNGTVTGNATFNDNSVNGGVGTVTANATFNDNSYNAIDGTVAGNATFNGTSINFGIVTGNATFNDNSGNVGTVTGNATFNDNSVNGGTVNGNVTCNTTGSCTPT